MSGHCVAVPEAVQAGAGVSVGTQHQDFSKLFHKLNNQLGVVLANAELLESHLAAEAERERAGLVVSGALEAIATIRDLRHRVSSLEELR
jgi:hypothetical protein